MRYLVFFFSCLLLLAPTLAYAETVSFGPEDIVYELDLPDGWQMEKVNDGVHVHQSDQKKAFSVSCLKAEGVTLHSLSQGISSRLGLVDVKRKETKRAAFITGSRDGIGLSIEIRVQDDCFLLIISAGLEKKELDLLLASLKRKVDTEEVGVGTGVKNSD